MLRTYEKGTIVINPEHSPETPPAKTRLFATLRALLGVQGRGAPSSAPYSCRLAIGAALALLAGVACLAVVAAPALAAGLPGVATCEIKGIRATRIFPKMDNVSPNGAPITGMNIELAPGESGPWTVVENKPSIGDLEERVEKLAPATPYYFRCAVENSVGTTTTKPVQFTTHAPEAPEIGGIKPAEIEGLTGEGFELGPTYATFEAIARGSEGNGPEAEVPAGIEANGAQTEYLFEYSLPEAGHAPAEDSPSWVPFTANASGSVSAAQEIANPKAKLTGLNPEIKYYLRLKAINSAGSTTKVEPFETTTTKPSASGGGAGAIEGEVSATSAVVYGAFHTRGFETEYRFEYSPPESGHAPPANSLSWTPAPGAEGTVAAIPPTEVGASEEFSHATARIAGLNPATTYYIRIAVDNGHGEATSSGAQSFETPGPPAAYTFPVHALHGETVRVLGAVDPHTAPIDAMQTLTLGGSPTGGFFTVGFEGENTAEIPFDARPTAVESALSALPRIGSGDVSVQGSPGGPYYVQFVGVKGGSSQPQLTADASGLGPSGSIAVATLQEGVSYDSQYHFEYVAQEQFAKSSGEGGFAEATSAPTVDLGAGQRDAQGYVTTVVGEDLPGLQAGQEYRFRLVAANTTPSNPVAHGESQALTVPAPAPAGATEPCENEDFRVGPSAHLSDCRAYEQVTPTEKHGAMDIFHYGGAGTEGSQTGEDGDHFMLHVPGVAWGSSPDDTASNYVFSRTPSGWRMASFRPEGSGSPDSFRPFLFDADLTQAAVAAGWVGSTSSSADVELDTGPPGGPYELVASVPRAKVSQQGLGLVAASADFSKLILATEDRKLIPGHTSPTASSDDLYEHAEGLLRQVNVTSGGAPISTCGAQIAVGQGESAGSLSSARAVSADGSRVLFVDNCTHQLYMRVDGRETIDIGADAFLAADAEDAKLVLSRHSGETSEFLLYDTETQASKLLFSIHGEAPGAFVSKDLSTIYVQSSQQLTPEAPPGLNGLYRYDLAAGTLRFLLTTGFSGDSMSSDGRYLYGTFRVVPGVAGGGAEAGGETSDQIYRLDTVDDVVECISCSSSFDPEPTLSALFGGEGYSHTESVSPTPESVFASSNGDYVFFDTPAALVTRDVDGERPPVNSSESPAEASGSYSRSSDVYEWRRNGLHGCTQVQGCLSLITSGAGGQLNVLLGVADEGRDVFFTSHESLVASDTDTAGDVYDARIGGGFPPPPPRPVECEGDACSTPAGAPNDLTPSSSTFQGAGNPLGAVVPEAKGRPMSKHVKAKKKKARKGIGPAQRGRKRRTRSGHAHHANVSGRSGK